MSSDIIGYDDMVAGDDDVDAILEAVSGYDIVGAAGSGGQSRRTRVNAAKLPLSFVGVPLTDITASSTGQVIQVPIQRAIRPDRLVLDRVQAASALIYDIKVGTVSLNASVNPVPGDAFSPDAMGTAIRAVVTAIPAVGIQLTVGNRTAVAITNFTAAFFGPSTPN